MRGLLALLCCLPASLTGQDSARVVVQYVASANVYLGGGTAAQIRTGDTLTARKVPSGEQVGGLVVVSSTEERSVVAFLGAPVSLTRGDTLAVLIAHAVVAPVAAAPGIPAPIGMGVPARPKGVRTSSGSLSLDLDQTGRPLRVDGRTYNLDMPPMGAGMNPPPGL